MRVPVWKGYEVAANLILDPEEWTTDNDMLTPSMKVKLRNLMSHHEAEIAKDPRLIVFSNTVMAYHLPVIIGVRFIQVGI